MYKLWTFHNFFVQVFQMCTYIYTFMQTKRKNNFLFYNAWNIFFSLTNIFCPPRDMTQMYIYYFMGTTRKGHNCPKHSYLWKSGQGFCHHVEHLWMIRTRPTFWEIIWIQRWKKLLVIWWWSWPSNAGHNIVKTMSVAFSILNTWNAKGRLYCTTQLGLDDFEIDGDIYKKNIIFCITCIPIYFWVYMLYKNKIGCLRQGQQRIRKRLLLL